MTCGRYLINFSYLGTGYRGVQWIKNNPVPTIEEEVIKAFSTILPAKFADFCISSRTDAGVHALNNCAHIDLVSTEDRQLNNLSIIYELNRYFLKHVKSIHINNIQIVKPNFHARFSAVSRTYLYRIAVRKNYVETSNNFVAFPIEEWKRAYLVRYENDFDIEKAKDMIKFFEGTHDFRTFKKTVQNNHAHKSCVKQILSAEIDVGVPLVTSYSLQRTLENFDFWDIKFRGKGFVHNQVRRMVAVLIGAAYGKLDKRALTLMLQIPSKHSWPSNLGVIPPHGLYLCNVEYNKEDLIYAENNIETNTKSIAVAI